VGAKKIEEIEDTEQVEGQEDLTHAQRLRKRKAEKMRLQMEVQKKQKEKQEQEKAQALEDQRRAEIEKKAQEELERVEKERKIAAKIKYEEELKKRELDRKKKELGIVDDGEWEKEEERKQLEKYEQENGEQTRLMAVLDDIDFSSGLTATNAKSSASLTNAVKEITSNENCSFCKMGNGSIAVSYVLKEKYFYAILDPGAVTSGQILISPIIHSASAYELGAEQWKEFGSMVKRISRALKKSDPTIGRVAVVLMENSDGDSDQWHTVAKLIPRRAQDGISIRASRPYKADHNQVAQLFSSLKAHLKDS
jgi:diadenosine tetraphosphate (Ap4A) HIT family hydrolase